MRMCGTVYPVLFSVPYYVQENNYQVLSIIFRANVEPNPPKFLHAQVFTCHLPGIRYRLLNLTRGDP